MRARSLEPLPAEGATVDGDFWIRTIGLLFLLTVIFVIPVVVLHRDQRRAQQEE